MKKIMFILSILLLHFSLAYAFEMGDVSVDVKDNSLIISSHRGEILNYEFDDSSLNYIYIIKTPYFKMSGYDGVVEQEYSKGLKIFPKKELSEDDFVRFSFFSKEKNSIGLLIGMAGASGGSSQDIYFINVSDGNFIKIVVADMQEMDWIAENGRIVGYENFDTNIYFRSHATSWGYKARISDVVYFGDDGKAMSKKEVLNSIFQSEYKKIVFSDEEKWLLQNNIMSDMQYRPIGEKLVDFVYYGFKLGKQDEVFAFLDTLHPIYAEEAKHYIEL